MLVDSSLALPIHMVGWDMIRNLADTSCLHPGIHHDLSTFHSDLDRIDWVLDKLYLAHTIHTVLIQTHHWSAIWISPAMSTVKLMRASSRVIILIVEGAVPQVCQRLLQPNLAAKVWAKALTSLIRDSTKRKTALKISFKFAKINHAIGSSCTRPFPFYNFHSLTALLGGSLAWTLFWTLQSSGGHHPASILLPIRIHEYRLCY